MIISTHPTTTDGTCRPFSIHPWNVKSVGFLFLFSLYWGVVTTQGLMDKGELAEINSSGIWHPAAPGFFPDFFLGKEITGGKIRFQNNQATLAGSGKSRKNLSLFFLYNSWRKRRARWLLIFSWGRRACWSPGQPGQTWEAYCPSSHISQQSDWYWAPGLSTSPRHRDQAGRLRTLTTTTTTTTTTSILITWYNTMTRHTDLARYL